jgi:hypothetical protein
MRSEPCARISPPVYRMAARNGFGEGICNHFSAVVPRHDDLFLVNSYGYAFRELTASKLLICDFHGNVLDGERPARGDRVLHPRRNSQAPAARQAHLPHPHALCRGVVDDRGRSPHLGRPGRAQILPPHGGRSRLQRSRALQTRGRAHCLRRWRCRHRLHETPRRDGAGPVPHGRPGTISIISSRPSRCS